MKKYCFDTSGLSTPLEQMPADIHDSLWGHVKKFIQAGHVAVTTEIFEEMTHIDGGIGEFIAESKSVILFEVQKGDWDWNTYLGSGLIDHNQKMTVAAMQMADMKVCAHRS